MGSVLGHQGVKFPGELKLLRERGSKIGVVVDEKKGAFA
jgi:hypothetical protein